MTSPQKRGIYIHIPFCPTHCFYCNFTIIPGRNFDSTAYLQALHAEIEQKGRFATGRSFSTLFLGGGTPSLLSPQEIDSLLQKCFQQFSWDNGAPQEVTMEANPRTLSQEKLKAFRKTGVTRLSLGAQSFSDEHLRRIGRPHRSKDIVENAGWAREAGFENLSLDLIYGLPEQNLAQWEQDLRQALALKPEHISAYALTIESGTFFKTLQEQGKLALPQEEEYVSMGALARELLGSMGLVHYEISNFARPSFESQHNLIYWQNGDYLGLGVSAHSYWDGLRFWNGTDTKEYQQKLLSSQDPRLAEERLNKKQAMSEAVFLGLRLPQKGVVFQEFKQRFQEDFEQVFSAVLPPLIKEGWLILNQGAVRLSEKALPVADEVALRFF